MSILSEIVGAGISLNRQIAGEAIRYTDGAYYVDITDAKPRGGERLVDKQGSAQLQTDEMEWIIKASELVLNAVAVKPNRGATIRWTVAGETLTFTLLQPDGMQQCWKWADRGHTHYHVFCKLKTRA